MEKILNISENYTPKFNQANDEDIKYINEYYFFKPISYKRLDKNYLCKNILLIYNYILDIIKTITKLIFIILTAIKEINSVIKIKDIYLYLVKQINEKILIRKIQFKNQDFIYENIIHFINIKNKNNLIRIRKIFIKNKYINPIIIFPQFDFRIDNYLYNIFDTFFQNILIIIYLRLLYINTTYIEIDKDNNKKKFYNNLNIINASKNNRIKKTKVSINNNNIEKKIQNNKTNSKNNIK